MKDTQFYEQLLGLTKPWSVDKVEMDLAASQVVVHVKCERGVVWGDPETEAHRAHVHGWVKREWRHLDTCHLHTRIVAEVPRLKYTSGKVEDAAVPWAERYSRITVLMEAFVISLLQAAPNIKQVAKLLRLDWHTVNALMLRAVERGMQRRKAEPLRYIGIDEKSFLRGHNYASVMTDIVGRRVLDVVPGRDLGRAKELLGRLTQEQRDGLQAAVIDMWPGYMSAIREMTDADIVHDKFHVSRYLNEAVDKVRRREHKQMNAQGDSALKGTKYQWLRRVDDKRSAQAHELRRLLLVCQRTGRAWVLKEGFARFWAYRSVSHAAQFFDAWATRAMRSRMQPFKDVAQMLRRHRQGLLNYTKHHVTNAAAEGFNSAIQALKTAARGFRNFEHYRARILFYCGGLELGPLRVGSH